MLDFCVSEGENEIFYRAERAFKRTGSKECTAVTARLSKGKENPQIIADKTKEMCIRDSINGGYTVLYIILMSENIYLCLFNINWFMIK